MPTTRSDNPSQEWDNNLASQWAFGQHLAALLSSLMIESALLLALWALFMAWTGWGRSAAEPLSCFPRVLQALQC